MTTEIPSRWTIPAEIQQALRRRVAYHEAGHAVAFAALGVRVIEARLITDEEEAERLEKDGNTRSRFDDFQCLSPILRAIPTIAGDVAQAMATSRDLAEVAETHLDAFWASDIADMLGSSSARFERIWRRTRCSSPEPERRARPSGARFEAMSRSMAFTSAGSKRVGSNWNMRSTQSLQATTLPVMTGPNPGTLCTALYETSAAAVAIPDDYPYTSSWNHQTWTEGQRHADYQP